MVGSNWVKRLGRAVGVLSLAVIAVAIAGCDAATPSPSATPATALPSPPAGLSVGAIEGLTVEEYPIAPQGEDRPDHFEFQRRIDPKILDKRRAWRRFARDGWVDTLNASLAGFGYRLVGNERSDHPSPLYNLLRGEALVLRDVATAWPIAFNATGDDFALVVEARQGGQFLIRPSGVGQWDPMEHAFTRPVFVDNDLVTLDLKEDHGVRVFAVVRAGMTVYVSAHVPGPVSEPIKGLWSWDGHWVLEVDGQVLVDGKSLNQELGYDEIFGWRLLKGEPFYFFRKGGRIGVSYAGRVLPQQYEEVIHYRCCEPAAFNVAGNDTMVWFYALKDGMWCYVEAGAYDEHPASPAPPGR